MIDVDYARSAPGWGWEIQFLWVLIAGFLAAFMVGFVMGANDVANAFGTIVGSGVLRLWQIYSMATIMNILGGALMGFKVATTVSQTTLNVSVYDVCLADFPWVTHKSPSNHSFRQEFGYLQQGQSCPPNPNRTLNHKILLTYEGGEYGSEGGACVRYSSPEYLVGELSVLMGVWVFVLGATVFSLPVSVTQSVVGGTVGYSFALRGHKGLNWYSVGGIVLSWVISPLIAGCLGTVVYLLLKLTIFMKEDQFESAFRVIPFVFFFALSINAWSILYQGTPFLYFNLLTWWEAGLISAGIGLGAALLIVFWGNKWFRRKSMEMHEKDKNMLTPSSGVESADECEEIEYCEIDSNPEENKNQRKSCWQKVKEHYHHDLNKYRHGYDETTLSFLRQNTGYATFTSEPLSPVKGVIGRLFTYVEIEERTIKLFHFLQIMSACFLSFAHGSNDTANAIGPLTGIYVTYTYGNAGVTAAKDYKVFLIRVFGGVAIGIGLWCLGHKVIKTLGKDITSIIAPVGFCMEIGAAFTVIFGNRLSIPLSTTHCAVGAVVVVGMVHSGKWTGVSWKMLGKILMGWLITLPAAGFLSAFFAYMFAKFYLHVS